MTDPYKLSLAAVRFFGLLNLVSGLAAIFAAAALLLLGVLATTTGPSEPFQLISSVMSMLLIYGVLYLVVGAGMLLCARSIARFTANVFVS